MPHALTSGNFQSLDFSAPGLVRRWLLIGYLPIHLLPSRIERGMASETWAALSVNRHTRRACGAGNLEVVKLMVQLGVDVNVRAAKGATPLHYAAHNGNVQLVRDLVALGADPNQKEHQAGGTPMHWASLGGHTDAMHIMAQMGGNVNAEASDLSSPLHWASSNGHLDVVQKLVDLGANLLAVCNKDRTPLRWAALNGHVEVRAHGFGRFRKHTRWVKVPYCLHTGAAGSGLWGFANV